MSAAIGTVDLVMALDRLATGLDQLGGVGLSSATDDELLEVLRRLERVRCRLAAVGAPVILEVDTRGIAAALGARHTPALLRGLLRIDGPEATRRVRAAEAITARHTVTGEPLAPAYPVLAAAQAAGSVSPERARVVVHTVEQLPDAVRWEQAGPVETQLVALAGQHDPEQLTRAARHLQALLDPDGILADAAYRDRTRGVHLHQRPDGSAHLDGELTAECAERLLVVFDALTRLATANALPTCAGVSATLVVTLDADTYRTGHGLARTSHGALVPARDAIAWGAGNPRAGLAGSEEKRWKGQPTTRRPATEKPGEADQHLPRLLHPPAPWCEIDHLQPWADGGPTSTDNGGLLCRHHHRHQRDQGWQPRLINGRVAWTPPRWIDRADQKPRYNTLHTRT